MTGFKYLHIIFICVFAVAYNPLQCQTQSRPKVGVVLSGGGAKGFAHVGVLKVLEEAGIPIDYIGGTSMGSIIGGLYALGYSADSIQSLLASQDWAVLLTDKISRKYLTIDEKEYEGKYFFPYPVSDGKFKIPSSLVSGQNIELLMSKLMWNYLDSIDFLKLPIPFLCVATDIENGKAVVMKNGNLPKAIRASMSIPTVFTPELYKGNLYVDGGIFNNFPVDAVREMGADIIIGVDVGFEPFSASELNSMLRIIEQSVFTHTIEKNNQSRRLCNVLIKPDLKKFNMMSFDETDSLIHYGKMAAFAQVETIKKLADSIKSFGPVKARQTIEIQKTFEIKNIRVIGQNKIPRTYILSKLNLKAPSVVSQANVEEGINRIYGTLLFYKVAYRFENDELIIEVNEKPQSAFSLGINYNTDYRASIYFNTTIYNLFIDGSKLSFDALLGENPRVNSTYFIFSGWNPKGLNPISGGWRFDFGINLNTSHYKLLNYEDTRVLSTYGYTDISGTLFMQTTFKNSYALGFGIQNEFTSRKSDINILIVPKSTTGFFNLVSYLKFDTYNRSHFPSKGVNLNVEGKYLTKVYNQELTPGILINGRYGIAAPVSKRIAIVTNFYTGLSIIDSLPETYQYRMGGVATYYVKNAFPFYGFKLLEVACRNTAIAKFNLQTEIFPKNFVILSFNVGRYSDKLEDLIVVNKNIFGYGLTYGYNSIIGPVELSLMKSNNHKMMAYVNVGFWF